MKRRHEAEVLGRRPGRIGNDTHCLYWFQVGESVIGINDNRLRKMFSDSFEQVDGHRIR